MSGRSSSFTASRSTMLAMTTAWSMVRPLAAIPSRTSAGRVLVPNAVSSLRTHLDRRLVDLELVRVRRQVPLERAARGQVVEEVELVEQLGGRLPHDLGERVDVHRHVAGGEGGHDLLQPQALADRHRRLLEGLAAEGGDDLRRLHGRRQVVGPERQRPGPVCRLDRPLEGERAAHDPLLGEQRADLRVAHPALDDDRDPLALLAGRRVRQRIGPIPVHEVVDQPVLDRAGMLLDPRHQPRGEREEADEDEEGEDRDHPGEPGEQHDRLEPATAADRRLALIAQLAHSRVRRSSSSRRGIRRLMQAPLSRAWGGSRRSPCRPGRPGIVAGSGGRPQRRARRSAAPACLPAAESSSPACQLVSRSSTSDTGRFDACASASPNSRAAAAWSPSLPSACSGRPSTNRSAPSLEASRTSSSIAAARRRVRRTPRANAIPVSVSPTARPMRRAPWSMPTRRVTTRGWRSARRAGASRWLRVRPRRRP